MNIMGILLLPIGHLSNAEKQSLWGLLESRKDKMQFMVLLYLKTWPGLVLAQLDTGVAGQIFILGMDIKQIKKQKSLNNWRIFRFKA